MLGLRFAHVVSVENEDSNMRCNSPVESIEQKLESELMQRVRVCAVTAASRVTIADEPNVFGFGTRHCLLHAGLA